jgi:hypothetical protein
MPFHDGSGFSPQVLYESLQRLGRIYEDRASRWGYDLFAICGLDMLELKGIS